MPPSPTTLMKSSMMENGWLDVVMFFWKLCLVPPPNPPDTFENDMTQTNARKTPTTSSSPSVKRTSASPAPSNGTSSDGTAASGEFSSSSSASWIPPLCPPPPAPPPAPLPARHYPSCFTPPHLPAFLYLCLKLTLSCTPAGQPILSSKSDRTLRYPKWPTFVGYLIFCIFLNSLYE